jgi:hypothetical protein
MKDNLLSIRCAIKFYINIINSLFVHQRFVLLEKWIKVRTKFIYLILNFILRELLRHYFNIRLQSKFEKFHSGIPLHLILTVLKTF